MLILTNAELQIRADGQKHHFWKDFAPEQEKMKKNDPKIKRKKCPVLTDAT